MTKVLIIQLKRLAVVFAFNLEEGPFFEAFVAADDVLYEGHAADALFDGGEVSFFARGISAFESCRKGQRKIPVEVAKGFEVTFRVAAGCTGVVSGKGGK